MNDVKADKYGRISYPLLTEWKPVNRVALVGKMHSGKSSVADVLVNNGYTRLAFAEELKDISVTLLNSLQISVMQHLGKKWTNLTRADLDKKKSKLRPLWQFIGAWGRDMYGEDVWIEVFKDRYERDLKFPGALLVLDDLRYANEAEYLRKNGWKVVRIERPEKDRLDSIRENFRKVHNRDIKKRELKDILGHESEAEVDNIEADTVILNNGSLARLKQATAMLAGNPALKHAVSQKSRW